MRLFSNSYRAFCRVVALVLAFLFLNASIDGRDRNPDFVPEDLMYNDIETFTEFLAEVVFNCQNAFAEHDEKDGESGASIDFYQYYFSNQALSLSKEIVPALDLEFCNSETQHILSLSRDVTVPPPKM